MTLVAVGPGPKVVIGTGVAQRRQFFHQGRMAAIGGVLGIPSGMGIEVAEQQWLMLAEMAPGLVDRPVRPPDVLVLPESMRPDTPQSQGFRSGDPDRQEVAGEGDGGEVE